MGAFTCDNCGKEFKRKSGLIYHTTNNVCKNKVNCCEQCSAKFTSRNALLRHTRTICKIKKHDENEDIIKKLMQLEHNNEELKKELDIAKSTLANFAEEKHKLSKKRKVKNHNNTKVIDNSNTTNDNTTNENCTINDNCTTNNNYTTNINKGTVNNIVLVGYGNEDLTKIDRAEILKALQNGFFSTVKLAEAIHFNPKHPEYQNVAISNMRDKYATMHNGKKWLLTSKDELINKIYDDKKSYIEDNLEEFSKILTFSRKNALNRWLSTDEQAPKIKDIKDRIKLLLYNAKNPIQ